MAEACTEPGLKGLGKVSELLPFDWSIAFILGQMAVSSIMPERRATKKMPTCRCSWFSARLIRFSNLINRQIRMAFPWKTNETFWHFLLFCSRFCIYKSSCRPLWFYLILPPRGDCNDKVASLIHRQVTKIYLGRKEKQSVLFFCLILLAPVAKRLGCSTRQLSAPISVMCSVAMCEKGPPEKWSIALHLI